MLWKKLIVGLAATTGLVFMGGTTAQAETIPYCTRADFQAATSGLSYEGFEDYFPSGKSISFSGFTLSVVNGSDLSRSNRYDLPSEGSWAVTSEQSPTLTSEFTFTFDVPVTAFGVDINDFADSWDDTKGESAIMTVTNDTPSFAYEFSTTKMLPEPNTLFFGVTDSSPFSSVTFTAYVPLAPDAIAFDALEFNQIPAPSSLVGLLSMGLVALVIAFRRRFRKAA